MSKIIGFLLPWRNTIRRLELHKQWRHRLAVVLFFVALIPVFLYSWVIGDDANRPSNDFEENIHHWGVLAGAPKGVLFDVDSEQPIDPSQSAVGFVPAIVQKTIEMPDGKVATYPGTTSDDTIKAEWQHKLNVAHERAASLGLEIAILVTLIFSYLLQGIYRAGLYVIYGAKQSSTMNE